MKEPISVGTDDFYLLAKSDLAKTLKYNLNEENETIEINLNIPVKEIIQIIVGEDKVEFPKYLSVERMIECLDKIIKQHKENSESNIVEITPEQWEYYNRMI